MKWLHLSDIHYCYENYNTEWLRDKLLDTIKDKELEFLFITGDLLYKFQNNFDGVQKFIDEIIQVTGIRKEYVLIVPGNHDFKRGKPRERIIVDIYSGGENNVADIISNLDSETYDFLIEGQQDFFNFYKDLLGREEPWKELHFIKEYDTCNIINLNTCLVSGQDKEEGNLSINLTKLIKVLKKVKNSSKLNIVIGHHSIECFHKTERDKILNLFVDYSVDIYLCGHVHKSKYETQNNSSRDIPTFICGAGMIDDYAEPSFIIGDFNLVNKEGCAKYFSWSKKNDRWYEDPDISRNMSIGGEIRFLAERLLVNDGFANNEYKKKIDEMTKVNIVGSKFKQFILDFCKNINLPKYTRDREKEKDVEEKFKKMKCTKEFQDEFDSNLEYFNIIDEVFTDTSYMPYDKKTLIPGIISSVYKKSFKKYENGDEIIDNMIYLLCQEYKREIDIPSLELEQYFKTVIYWSINMCSIYNDEK